MSKNFLSAFCSMKSIILVIASLSLLANSIAWGAASEYEKPAVLSAAELLSRELLKGPNYTVAEPVQNDGLFNHYTVDSPFGTFTAPSTNALYFLINEINAIAEMKKVQTDDTAIASLKQSGENTLTGIKSLFTDTEDTLKGAASGVQSLFHRAKETIGSREVTGAEDSKAEQIIGFSKSKGKIATSFNVNVYSRNNVLQEELDRLAWADYLGGLGIGLATSAIPGVGGIVLTASGTARLLNEAINTTPASELWVQNRDKLLALGMDGDTVQLFLNNQMFSPALATVMSSALESMKGVGNLELFLKISLQANSPEVARVLTEMTVLYAGYHQHIKPLEAFVPLARIARAVGSDGSVIVTLPADHLIWSERVSGAFDQISEEIGEAGVGKEFWILGDVSSRALRKLENSGFKVLTGAKDQLIPQKQ